MHQIMGRGYPLPSLPTTLTPRSLEGSQASLSKLGEPMFPIKGPTGHITQLEL
jgi:hypothetical protein